MTPLLITLAISFSIFLRVMYSLWVDDKVRIAEYADGLHYIEIQDSFWGTWSRESNVRGKHQVLSGDGVIKQGSDYYLSLIHI